MWTAMDPHNDNSDYEDEAKSPSYQLFPAQDYPPAPTSHHPEKDIYRYYEIGNNSSVENISDHGTPPVYFNNKGDTPKASQSTTSAASASISRYSRLLHIFSSGKTGALNLNDKVGENSSESVSSVQSNSSLLNVDYLKESQNWPLIEASNTVEDEATQDAQKEWSSRSDYDGDYTPETFFGHSKAVENNLMNHTHDNSLLTSCSAEAASTSIEMVKSAELPSNNLSDKAAKDKFNNRYIDSVCTSPASIAHQQTSCLEESFTSMNHSDSREPGPHGGDLGASSIKESRSSSTEEDVSFKRVKDQLKVFHLRIKVYNYTHTLLEDSRKVLGSSSKLEAYIKQLTLAVSVDDLVQKLLLFSEALKSDMQLASCFLTNLISYVQSVLDLEKNLSDINEILDYLIPSVNIVVNSNIDKKTIQNIQNENFMQILYKNTVNIFNRESKYRETSINDLLQYEQGRKTVKAHIVRMSPEDSQKLFQETFDDVGSVSNLYLIYVWRIYKIYEVEEGNTPESSVTSLTEVMKNSGKFLSIVPTKDLLSKERKVPYTQIGKKLRAEESDTMNDTSKTLVDMSFEWADFRIGQLYENGVVFLTNMDNWADRLQEISASIEKLEVKKKVKFLPTLGSTYALSLQHGISVLNGEEDVSYIRVRVVRSVGPVVWVYGIDMGNIHLCDAAQLILLPAYIINFQPCGRLAQLPVVPAPSVTEVKPSLALLVALVQRADLAEQLCNIDIQHMAIWMQLKALTQLTLDFLEAIINAIPRTHHLSDICLVISDYLLGLTSRNTNETACMATAFSILISAMKTSSKIRLLLAKEGAFTTLCDLGVRKGEEQAWQVMKILLGGDITMKMWSSQSSKVSLIHHKRGPQKWEAERPLVPAANSPTNGDNSPAITNMVAMTLPDYNWDLEMRNTINTRQFVPYSTHRGWQREKKETLSPNVGELQYGHVLNVKNDETHHIILDKSVPNIRMNTLLQIILGMLNTGLGGKIYIGLNKSGVIHGVKINRNQRDCFMLGFLKLVTSEIFPKVLPCDTLIQFLHVIRCGVLPVTTQNLTAETPDLNESDYYVIILTVRPLSSSPYRSRDDPDPIFLREGGVTSTLRGHRLSQFMSTFTKKTQELQQQVSQEKQSLLNLILTNES
ncbi:uncharacterized protein LOC121862837 [Homarus americanus]|uniref:Schlafen AlbA-2 domain-containing protein n=1 Tax=Homarus americanus TaxID=6706 RepID=A0A8J5NEC1_HOMAM|nr:uncharacterized protein LOC121862837 [Homarus americanus]XP_042217103.1 uncharacterized protein LOC121862837 [Homarus americanus]XP_042217109.1 uncharacterized protein LOC121862837 [Homarus americanus]KAG7177729.1 hypothetical protein Hamer_G008398 [Homarus americanus]